MSTEFTGNAPGLDARHLTANSLSDHMRRLRRRNRGVSPWLIFAVLFGAAIALGFVGLFAH